MRQNYFDAPGFLPTLSCDGDVIAYLCSQVVGQDGIGFRYLEQAGRGAGDRYRYGAAFMARPDCNYLLL